MTTCVIMMDADTFFTDQLRISAIRIEAFGSSRISRSGFGSPCSMTSTTHQQPGRDE